MAEPAFIVLPAAAAGAGRAGASAVQRRPGVPAWLHRRAELPPGRVGAEPEAADATDYTAFSMVGVAG